MTLGSTLDSSGGEAAERMGSARGRHAAHPGRGRGPGPGGNQLWRSARDPQLSVGYHGGGSGHLGAGCLRLRAGRAQGGSRHQSGQCPGLQCIPPVARQPRIRGAERQLSRLDRLSPTGAGQMARPERPALESGQSPKNGVSNSLPGLVFFGVTVRLLCQKTQPMVKPTLKSFFDSTRGLLAKAVPSRFS
jgi:hypothetical protein